MASTPSQERQATEGSEVAEVERSSEENAQRPSAGGEKTQNNDRDIGDHSKDNDENKDNDNESEDDDRSHVGSSSSSNEDDSEEEEEESDSSNSNSSDDDDDNKNNGGNNNENQGLSDYELLRLERIKRNKERLVQLGLESKDGGGVLGKKKKPTSQKRRTSASSTDKLAAPTRRSRRSSAGAVASYAEQNLSTRSIVGEAEKKDPSKSSSKSNSNLAGISGEDNKLRRVGARKEKVREERIPRFIYDEFQSIKTNKKDMLKQAEKYARKSEVEYKYWRKRAHVVERRAEREREYQEMLSKLEEEKAIFGTGAYQFVQDLERRVPEIIANVEHYDSMQVNKEKQVEEEVRRLENESKLKLLDALDAYPKAMKDTISTLNSFLLERVPKDQPPPRRSKRKSGGDEAETEILENPAKKKKGDKVPGDTASEFAKSSAKAHHEALSHAAAQASLSQAEYSLENRNADSPQVNKGPSSQTKRRRELNVGGWVSPLFAASVNRSWLEKDSAPKSFDLKTYVPQPGDTLLYYPEGHRNFLTKYPDALGAKKITRMPLWERAKKEQAKASKENDANAKSQSAKNWWNDEWIASAESSLGKYPIICRVEKTQANFPPDPYKDLKTMVDGKVVWKVPTGMTKSKVEKTAPMRLAVTLRPLTSVMPPKWTESGPIDDNPLVPPPPFTAVTFPSSLEPYLVPLSWAYIHNHSLSVGDELKITDSKGKQKGKVLEFSTIEGGYGSFRLEDKMSYVKNLVAQLSKRQASYSAVDNSATSGRSSSSTSISPQDVFAISEFLSKVQVSSDSHSENTEAKEPIEFVDFVRSTLPLWNGVSILRNVYDRKATWTQSWGLQAKKARSDKEASSLKFLLEDYLAEGFPRTLDNMLRVKIECSIEDLVRENQQLDIFLSPVTEDIAPSYSCAVPVSMCFERILQRLKNPTNAAEGKSKCYYRTFDAIMADLNVIQDNCSLYNDPESFVAHAANEVIPTTKKFLANVASRHVKERAEKIKAENEKRDFVMMNCNASALLESDETTTVPTSGTKLSKDNIFDPFKTPFKDHLFTDWVQLTNPDSSWRQDKKMSEPVLSWVPQVGDAVLYSRSLHASFVKGHYGSLNVSQCILPQFHRDDRAKEDEPGSSDLKHIKSQGMVTDEQLSEVLESGWILGTILWSKTDFPRPRTLTNPSGGDENGFFETEAPVLTLGLRFPGYELTLEKKPVIIHWRPCKFSSGIESPESECCGSCDVPIKTSFLRPAWLNGHREGNVTQPPSGLLKEDSSAIERCFNLLKRRCLNNVPADHMDANLTNKKVKGGYIPQMVKVGSKSLPEYHEILKVDYESPKNSKTISTRGIRREPDAEMSQLARFNFLPPWLPESSLANGSEQETQAVLLHDTLSPCPRLCLELVLVRLKNGYYRQKAAIHNDLVEAYVTSVLLALAPYAKRKKSAISIKRLVSALSSKKSPVLPSLSKQLSESKKSVVPVNANMPGSNSNSPSMKGSTSPAGPTKKAKTTETISSSSKSRPEDPSNIIRERCENGNAKQGVNNKAEAEKNNTAKSASSVFTEEETALLERLEAIRRLYASAIVCISDTTHVQNLFGLSSLQVPRQIIQQNVMTVSPDQAPAVMARETLEQLLVALGRDSRVNRQRHSGSLPSVKVKFKCVQEIVKTEAVVQIRVSVPPVSCVGRSDGGESSAAFEKPAPTTSDVNRKSGGAPPSAVEQAQAPVDESLSQATVGSKGESNLPLPLVQDQAPEAPKTSNVRMVLDCVDFKPEDYENDFTLSRLFFGKPGRMDRCIRCAARHRTMLTCRVRKGHSNIDFDLVGTFKGAGGLDGLFNILFQRPNASEAVIPMAPQSNQEGIKEGQSSAPEEIGQNNDTTDDALKKVDKQDHQQDNNVATAPTAPPSAENNNDKENEVTEKGQDPRLLFEKAKAAHELAKEVLGSAKVYAEAPLRLSDEFIACNFPFDTADGHYSFCIICGLSGDLLCCDGCANVAHPACANLSAIPEGDWFCSEHCGKKKLSCLRSPPQDTSMKSASTASNSSETEKAQPTTLNANKNDGLVANGVGVQGKKENFAAEEGDAGGQDETSNENAGHADAPTTFSEIPPAVTFDRKKLETLKAQLEELSKLRLRRPSKQRENNQDAENESSGMPGAVNEERASGDTKWPGKDGAADDKQPTSIGVGTKFVKRFGRHGFFKGELVSEPNDTHPFYRAKYEDGDEEDLEEFEVLDYLKRWGQKIGKTQKKGSAKEENSQKKQDKPSKTKHDADQQPARGNGVAEASKTDDKRPRGRPRKPPVEGETEKRPRGRPRKRPLEEVDVTESEKEASDPIKKAKVSEAPTVAPKAQVVQPLSSASKAGDTDAFSNNKSNAADNPSGATSTGGRRRK